MSEQTTQICSAVDDGSAKHRFRRERGLMNKDECAAFLGIKKRTLEKYMAERQIPFIRLSQKLVLFHLDDVMAALRGRSR
jgi:excisionase family DNA binding protein